MNQHTAIKLQTFIQQETEQNNLKKNPAHSRDFLSGEGGIRTLGTVSRTHV